MRTLFVGICSMVSACAGKRTHSRASVCACVCARVVVKPDRTDAHVRTRPGLILPICVAHCEHAARLGVDWSFGKPAVQTHTHTHTRVAERRDVLALASAKIFARRMVSINQLSFEIKFPRIKNSGDPPKTNKTGGNLIRFASRV